MKRWIIAALMGSVLAGPLAAKEPPLVENQYVVNGFYVIGTADIIRKTCPTIDARIFRAVRLLGSLERYAKDQGYSEAEIDEFLDDEVAEDALRARIKADLAERGAPDGDVEGHCRVGLEEITADSSVGRLLRARN